MSKKVVIISPAHPLRGGIAAFGERLASALQKADHTVIIYTFSLQYPSFLFPGKTQFSEDSKPEDLHIKVCINAVNPLNWWKVGDEIKQLRPDWVICMFWLPFMGASLGTILRRIRKNGYSRIVGMIHNIIPHEKRIGDRTLAQYFVRSLDSAVVLSQSVANDMQQFGNQPVVVTPHPIYDSYGEPIAQAQARLHLNLAVEGKYILFFGFIRDYKGLDLLLKAMSDERLRIMGVKLVVAGEYYSNREEYESLIQALNLSDQLVLHTQFISNEAVKYYFSAVDLVVQPYRSATQSGISQLAYHFDKPMIVTNVGGLPEIVPDGVAGYVVKQNAQSIADAIYDFYKSDKAAILLAGVQQQKKRFSWAHLVKAIEEVAE